VTRYNFANFAHLGSKSAHETVWQVLAKMLVAIPGVTPRTAKAVIDSYDSPKKLHEAIDAVKDPVERHKLWQSLKVREPSVKLRIGAELSD